jgi:effector-binding domain-containing protein
MKYNFKVVELKPQPGLVIKEKLAFADIPKKMPGFFEEICRFAAEKKIKFAGAPFAYYSSWTDKETEIEVGIPVGPGVAGEGRIQKTTLPGGKVVTGTHVGPYDKLAASYGEMTKWMKAHGYKQANCMWEVYLTDPDVEKDQAKHVTEMFWPEK